MKPNIKALSVVLLFAVAAYIWWQRSNSGFERGEYVPKVKLTKEPHIRRSLPSEPEKRAAGDLTPDEKAALAKVFHERLQPALTNWFRAYEGRITFELGDVTLDRFIVKDGNIYSFIVNGSALEFANEAKGAWVFYFSAAGALTKLNTLPAPGTAPNVSTPLKRDEVLRMVNADTGLGWKSSDVTLTPTGMSTAMGGGVSVDVGGLTPDGVYVRMTGHNMTLTFDAGGKLVNYGGPADK
jgi:hypothetical protein